MREKLFDLIVDKLPDDVPFDLLPDVDAIVDAILANDVVEVVRCKDCAYCRYVDGAEVYRCDRRGYYAEEVKPDDYCSRGERGEG